MCIRETTMKKIIDYSKKEDVFIPNTLADLIKKLSLYLT